MRRAAERNLHRLLTMRIAYLVNQYPAVSHSFIRREIAALERQGAQVLRLALRGWRAPLVDDADLAERARTRYALRGGVLVLLLALLAAALRRPRRFVAALRLALRMAVCAARPWPLHLAYLAEACRIVPWLEQFGARHLHAHFGTNSAEVAMLARALGGPPYSFTAHGPKEFDQPERLRLGDKVRQAAFVVAISSFGRSQLYRWVDPSHWRKVHVVHCGLEPGFHESAPPCDRPRLVCVGRLCEQKGQLLLVEAAARVAKTHPRFELVLVGDGELRPRLEAAIAHHRLSEQVRITGWLSGREVRREILAARALVLPSFAEGLPVALMEAMALRRPVLTTRIAGVPELVRHGEDGWLITPGCIEGLEAAMRECLALDGAQLARLGENARRRVLARHDADREASKLAALFHAARGYR
jgi:glycosyltransferase involved in cell wall biosynthesis